MGFDFSSVADVLGIRSGDGVMSFGSVGKTSLTSYLNLNSFRSLENSFKRITLSNLNSGSAIPHVYKSGARIKGYLVDAEDTSNKRKFQYNPQSMDYSRGATYAQVKAPGMQYPLIYFVNGEAEEFELELFVVDRPSTGKINKDIDWCKSFLPKYRNDDFFSRPHPLIYSYGNFVCKCVLTNFSPHIDEYDESGEPWMAHLKLKLLIVDVPNVSKSSNILDIPGTIKN